MTPSSTLGRAALTTALAMLLPCAAQAQSPNVLIVVEEANTTIGVDAYERFAETLLGTGAASVDFAPDLSRELASYKVVVLSLYPISAAERPRLTSFVQEGGVLLMIGEWQTYNEYYQPGEDYVAAFNAFLEAQGVGTRFVFESDDWSSGTSTFEIFPHSLTRGVERVNGGGIGVIASGSAASVLIRHPDDTPEDVLVIEDWILMSSDSNQWSGQSIPSDSDALWGRLVPYACDQDDDGARDSACGGTDWDDRDAEVQVEPPPPGSDDPDGGARGPDAGGRSLGADADAGAGSTADAGSADSGMPRTPRRPRGGCAVAGGGPSLGWAALVVGALACTRRLAARRRKLDRATQPS